MLSLDRKTENLKNPNRKKLISRLGNRCTVCGQTTNRYLEIYPIKGGGRYNNTRRVMTSPRMFEHYANSKDLELFKNKYEVLCVNCDMKKGADNNEPRWEKDAYAIHFL